MNDLPLICPSCGAGNGRSRESCSECGANLFGRSRAAASNRSTPTAGKQHDELVRLARAAEARDRARDRGGAVFAAFAVSVVAGVLWANGAGLWIVFAILAALAWAGVVVMERRPYKS